MALKLSVEVQAVTKDAIDRLDKLRAKLRELGSGGNFATKELEGVSSKLQALSSGVQNATNQLAAGGRRAREGLAPVSQQLGNIQGQLVALASGFSVFQAFRQFITATDQVSNLNAQLRLATRSSEEFAAAQSIVTDIANRFGVRIGDAAQSFARLSQAIRTLGGGLAEASALTEALSAATKVSGISAQEASASMIQFAQALGSGVLQGDELRSILENNRRLAKAVADGLGVSVGELKKLGEAGKLTSEVVAKAVISQLAQLRAEAELVPDTFERAGNRLFNAFATWVAASQQAASAQANVIGFVNALAANIDKVVLGIQAIGTVIVGVFAGRALQAIVRFAAEVRIAVAALGTAGAGAAALGGPISLAIGLAAALGGAFLLFGQNAANATEQAKEGVDKLIASLREQNAQQEKLNNLPTAQADTLSETTKAFIALSKRSQELKRQLNESFGEQDALTVDLGFGSTSADRSKLAKELVQIETQMRTLAEEMDRTKKVEFFKSEAAEAEKFNRETRAASTQFFELAKQFQTEAEKNRDLVKQLRELGAKGQVRPEVIAETVARVGKKKPSRDETAFRSALVSEEKASLEAETRLQTDTIQRQERELKESYERRAISAQEFFNKQRDLQLETIDVEIRQLRRLREIEEASAQGPDSTAADRVRASTEILRINRDIEIQTRRRGDVEQQAARDIVQANKEVQESLEQVRFRLKELTGTATLDDIRKNALRGRKELFDSLKGDDQAQIDVLKLTNIEAVQEQLQRLQTEADRVLSTVSEKQEELQIKAQIGALSSRDAEDLLNQERLQAAKTLDELIARMNALRDGNISAFGPEQEAAIRRYGLRLKELSVVANETARKVKDSFEGPLTNLFTDLIKGTKTAKEAFEDFANAVVDALVRIAAQKAAQSILDSLFNTAGQTQGGTSSSGNNTGQSINALAQLGQLATVFFASGGMVRGPGTTTSDSIPAMLSRDEFVVKASTVKKVGADTMYALNAGSPRLIEALKTATQRLNSGGLAGDYRSERSTATALRDVAQSTDRSERVSVLRSVRDALSRVTGRAQSSATQSVVVIDRQSSESRQSASERESDRTLAEVSRQASTEAGWMVAVREVRDAVRSAVKDSRAYAALQRIFDRTSSARQVDRSESISGTASLSKETSESRSSRQSDTLKATSSSTSAATLSSRPTATQTTTLTAAQTGDLSSAPAAMPSSITSHTTTATQHGMPGISAASTTTNTPISNQIGATTAYLSIIPGGEFHSSTAQEAESVSERVEKTRAEVVTKNAVQFFKDASRLVTERFSQVFNAPRIAVERLIDVSRDYREQRFSVGGMVKGPGSTTSDSIQARLSRDEFVVKADTVRKIGPSIMYALNEGHPKILQALRVASEGVQNFTTNIATPGVQTSFAMGGMVMPGPSTSNVINNQPQVNFVVNTPDVGGVMKNQTQITQELMRAMRSATSRS